jgi:hypothetical protein
MAMTEKVSGAAPETIADVADQRAAHRTHQVADRENAERRKELGDRVLVREELSTDRRGEVAVNCKVVPFEHVADHAGSDHFACLRGNHLPSPRRRCAPSPTLKL